MTLPTVGERAFARRLGLEEEDVAQARDVLNGIAALPWPESVRIALLVQLAQNVDADVGDILGEMALDIVPLQSFEQLLPIVGLGDFRVAGLVHALSQVQPKDFGFDAAQFQELRDDLAATRAENQSLRQELDLLKLQLGSELEAGTESRLNPQVLPLRDVALNIVEQLSVASDVLKGSDSLRFIGTQVELRGTATTQDDDLAFDFKQSEPGGSALTLGFRAQQGKGVAPQDDEIVPDVRGYSPTLARRKLEALGMSVFLDQRVVRVASDLSPGTVIEQSLEPGAMAAPGTSVRLSYLVTTSP